MEYVPDLPPGAWASAEAEEGFQRLLERRESIIAVFRQGLYLSLCGSYPPPPRSPELFRARLEREHKINCDKVEAEIKEHCKRYYVPDAKVWEPDFELRWVRIDD